MAALFSQILFWVLALDLFTLGVMLLFMVNARVNLRREITEQRIYFNAMALASMMTTCEEAAERMHISTNDFKSLCELKNIELPEVRLERIKQEKEADEAEKQRIMAEEAAWRAEQERIMEERRKAAEEDARTRKERLRKFGFS